MMQIEVTMLVHVDREEYQNDPEQVVEIIKDLLYDVSIDIEDIEAKEV